MTKSRLCEKEGQDTSRHIIYREEAVNWVVRLFFEKSEKRGKKVLTNVVGRGILTKLSPR